MFIIALIKIKYPTVILFRYYIIRCYYNDNENFFIYSFNEENIVKYETNGTKRWIIRIEKRPYLYIHVLWSARMRSHAASSAITGDTMLIITSTVIIIIILWPRWRDSQPVAFMNAHNRPIGSHLRPVVFPPLD